MFGKKKKETSNSIDNTYTSSKKMSGANVQSACVIVYGTVIEGQFKSTNDTRLDGTIIGDISCDARIIMGKQAVIQGNVFTKQASISGDFKGDIQVADTLVLGGTAIIDGNINANELEVKEGAVINGDILIGKKEAGKSGEVRKK